MKQFKIEKIVQIRMLKQFKIIKTIEIVEKK